MPSRMFTAAMIAMSIGLVGACERREAAPQDGTATTAPDNSDRNERDRDAGAKTPLDQSEASADVKITAAIRRAILDDKSMSVNAQNIKIVTEQSGVVTLRGPVDTQAEKDAIEAKAKAVAGVTRVDNQLEVK